MPPKHASSAKRRTGGRLRRTADGLKRHAAEAAR